jgi:hypothetical protein
MIVKNLVGWAGDRFHYDPGAIVEMDVATAEARIAAGLAAEFKGNLEGHTVLQHPAADKAPRPDKARAHLFHDPKAAKAEG